MNPYPPFNDDKNLLDDLRQISAYRNSDIIDFNNLPNRFVKGRLVSRVAPANSGDVAATDKEFDRVCAASGANGYEYILLNDAGTLKWYRFSGTTF